MADKKPKTRFQIEAAGRLRELFSVQSEKDGTTTLFIKFANQQESNPDKVVKSQKFSIHATKNSADAGRTIKQTIIFNDNSEKNTYQYRIPNERGFSAIIYSRLCTDLNNEIYLSNPRDGDLQEIIVPYDAAEVVLLYIVIASDPPIPLESFLPAGMNITEFEMPSLQLIILSSFFPVHPIPQGQMMGQFTDPDITKYMVGEKHITSDSVEEMLLYIEFVKHSMRENLRGRIKNFAKLDDETTALVDKLLNIGPVPQVLSPST
ncbi:hypothetical protein [Sphingopyxis sp. QXT-31]|uniref:hypothetical protein n=1 Tax=Sphingopyxis sp. QXT-31 TaxID=1357916 RepID=UPI0012EC72D2|nr:hypothetical protein [Sphingopyxis sp. QXT-31]